MSGDEKADHQKEMVNIMTVHSAKGLEFEAVFIPGLEDGVFPSGRATAERNGVEEERRLLYVAITRAKRLLHLSFAQNRFTFGQMQTAIPSPFLKELPQEVLIGNEYGSWEMPEETRQMVDSYKNELSNSSTNFINKRVFHQKFGYGKVRTADGERLEIEFEKGGSKTIMKNFVSFNKE